MAIPSSLPSPGMSITGMLDSPPSSDNDLPLSPRKCKRKRSMPITPPSTVDDPDSARTLRLAFHVLRTEAEALLNVNLLYDTDPTAKASLLRAIDCIVDTDEAGGTTHICGVGKSAYIGMKLAATMQSMSLSCQFLHAAEAMHGDLGRIRRNDSVLFITFSGRTSELMNLIQHVPDTVQIMALTSHTDVANCVLLAGRPDAILLPAPIPKSEESTFGVSAPTTSTTVALAVGDVLALAAADKKHGDEAGRVFKKNHPGGAIGEKKSAT